MDKERIRKVLEPFRAEAVELPTAWADDEPYWLDSPDFEGVSSEFTVGDVRSAARLYDDLSTEPPGEYDGLVAVLLGRAGWSTGTREAAATAITTLQSRIAEERTRAETAEAERDRLREALTETLTIATRNEEGPWAERARAALNKEPT